MITRALCEWCDEPLGGVGRPDRLYCDRKCRQAAWRARRVSLMEARDRSLRFAYADPPFPGMAELYYGDRPECTGEVDHVLLASFLQGFDGWALSTSEKALGDLLPICKQAAGKRRVRVAPWVKPIGASGQTRGPHNTWEPVIYCPGRFQRPGRRDWLRALPARGGGDLHGRKPVAFCRWLFGLLGMAPGDDLTDVFPGSGIVGRVWRQLSPGYVPNPSPEYWADEARRSLQVATAKSGSRAAS